ncbi:MAG: ASKHA domain-containing protein [Burkholderiaceae bacterium]|nr:ASKHA domain-containing protein [Burkholderiaceae bacterium]
MSSAASSSHRPHRIDVPALDRQIECREDETLFAAARRAGLRIVGACGGRGSCGSCIVRVTEGRVHREGEGAHRKWLRACCIQPRSDLTVEVAPRSLAPIVRADVRTHGGHEGEEALLPLDPSLSAIELTLPPATLQDLASDADRLRSGLAEQPEPIQPTTIDWAASAELPSVLRQHGWQVQARLRQAEAGGPLSVASVARPGAPLLGLAVDLGTTNAAAFLVDLTCGRRLASLGLENPQVAWGADLISRINHAIKEPATAEALRRAAVGAIQSLAHDLARAVGAQVTDIADAVVCGNTAMQHLLAGWPVAQLGRAPFVAAALEPLDVAADRLGLALGPGAALHLAPSIGGFVGGDHVTALLATEAIWQAPGVSLIMDVGTNTEISLIHDGRILSASCPSGPALEGGHIGSGMRAAEGAIERVEVVDDALRLQVIGAVVPVGLCGSGVLDALAAFVGAGWIDARGRIVAGRHPCIAEVDGVRAVTLAEETEERHRSIPAVRFSQNDVRAVQLAKSAIRTGVRLLCAEAGLDESQIHRFVIAGAFGAYIRVESARAIGLLPPLPLDRFEQVGNAAGLGVQQMLSSRERRQRAAQIARQARYVELSSRSDFQKTFLQHIGFGS